MVRPKYNQAPPTLFLYIQRTVDDALLDNERNEGAKHLFLKLILCVCLFLD